MAWPELAAPELVSGLELARPELVAGAGLMAGLELASRLKLVSGLELVFGLELAPGPGLAGGMGLARPELVDGLGQAVGVPLALRLLLGVGVGLVLGVGVVLGVGAGLVLGVGVALAVGLWLAGGVARAGVCVVQLAESGCWLSGVLGVVPPTVASPLGGTGLPWLFTPGPPVLPELLPSRELTSAPVSDDTCCRSTGAPAYAPIATTNAATARAAARRPRTRRRWPGVPGCARQRSRPGPGTVCSQDQWASRPPSARRDTPEQAAITQASSNGYGFLSRAWIRSSPSPEGSAASAAACSARRTMSSKSARCWVKSHPSTPRSAAIARATWLLTAPRLIPIAEAISASGKSA